jgi:glucose/arabinose dehydrogenase
MAAMSPRFGRKVIRLELKSTPEGMRVAGEEFLLAELNGVRFRDVKEGPDGALYVASSELIHRVVPKRP